jgi:thiamine-phosphate pyrophosphorylase
MNLPKGLYGITSPEDRKPLEAVKMMVDKGARLIQYRDKELDEFMYGQNAERIMGFCDSAGVLLFVNDWASVALELGSNLHIGPGDMDPSVLRQDGFGGLIGYSIYSQDGFLKAERDGILRQVDCVGVGPVSHSSTKPGKIPLGACELKDIIGISTLPVYLTGGLSDENVGGVLSIDPYGVAVSSAKFRCSPSMVKKIVAHYG